MVLALYTGEPQHTVFPHMDQHFPIRKMPASSTPFDFSEGSWVDLPEQFSFAGKARSTQQFIEDTDTSALLVLKDGAIRSENYYLSGGRDVRWISWSMAKSFVSALIGIAIGTLA